MAETIYALSSGAPPAGIGVMRVSGPEAGAALAGLCGKLPKPRVATLSQVRDAQGRLLDEALILWFPGPGSATGEDCAEIHCHGGRAVVAAIERALSSIKGLRRAKPGEFTRRGFANGRMDLAEAEGLADLLEAETEIQRAAAMAMAGGKWSRQVERWRERLLTLAAQVEAALDFSDEDDVDSLPPAFTTQVAALEAEINSRLARPRAERLKDGFRVLLAGPPNAGKSTLFNALLENEAAITSPVAGTTRDVLERPVAIEGLPFTLVDSAGLRDDSDDAIEVMGVARARAEMERADCVLWLGPDDGCPAQAVQVYAKSDLTGLGEGAVGGLHVSAKTGEGVQELTRLLTDQARGAMPKPGEVALNERHFHLLDEARRGLHEASSQALNQGDPLVIAEGLRAARVAFDRLIGRAGAEDMLDTLFGRFCIGK